MTTRILSVLGMTAYCAGCTPSTEAPPPATGPDIPEAAAEIDAAAEWPRYTDSQRGVTFRYPRDFGTRYIHALDWPPMVQLVEDPLECTEAGSETARAGRTELAEIDGRRYCVTRVTEGAAGSIYTSYAYAFETDGGVAILTFSARAVQCSNYDEPQMSECDAEREIFDLDELMDDVARTITVSD